MRLRKVFIFLLAVTFGPSALRADPPARVGRLSAFEGYVSFRPYGLDEWGQAVVNDPLTTGDHLWTDRGGRSEIQVGHGTVLRLGSETSFAFLDLGDGIAQMQLTTGSIALAVRRLDEDEVVEVDTPNGAVSVLSPGFYRIDVTPDGEQTRVTVRRGEAEVAEAGEVLPVRAGETIVLNGGDYPSYDESEADAENNWERWAHERDVLRAERAPSLRYVSEEVVGYEDLDHYGLWRENAQYGPLWIPTRVSSNWAPYREGHWGWVAPWGWTWIDDSPWGFAPFHYGRWVHLEGSWAWVPGNRTVRPVYAPALVAFVGGGSFASLAVGGDGIAWFPLASQEVYVPPYPVSTAYAQNVNRSTVTNVTNITNVTNVAVSKTQYINQGVPGALTAVPRQAFVSAQPVANVAVIVPPGVATKVVIKPTGIAEVQPQRESVLRMGLEPKAVPQPPAAVAQRAVVARVQPPPPPPPKSIAGVPTASATPPPVKLATGPTGGAALKAARVGLPSPQPVPAGAGPARHPAGGVPPPPVAAPPALPSPKPPIQGAGHPPSPSTNERPTPAPPLPPVTLAPRPHPSERPPSTPPPPPPPPTTVPLTVPPRPHVNPRAEPPTTPRPPIATSEMPTSPTTMPPKTHPTETPEPAPRPSAAAEKPKPPTTMPPKAHPTETPAPIPRPSTTVAPTTVPGRPPAETRKPNDRGNKPGPSPSPSPKS